MRAFRPTYIQSPFTLSYSIAWLWVSDDCLSDPIYGHFIQKPTSVKGQLAMFGWCLSRGECGIAAVVIVS